MKRRVLFGLVALITSGLVFVGVSYAKPFTPQIKIGVLTTSSGPLYFAGAIQKAATKMAIDDLQANGVKASAFFEDVISQEPKVAFKNLRRADVDVVLGSIDSASTKIVMQTDERDPLPVLAPSSIGDDVDGSIDGTNWLFRLSTSISQDNNALVELIAKSKNPSVVIVSGTDGYSLAAKRTIAFGLGLRGVTNVGVYSVNDISSIRKTKPDVLVLASMEESIGFLNNMSDWVDGIGKVYLLPGNLANYSMYSWAADLAGAEAIVPDALANSSFRARLADEMGKPYLLNSPNSPIFTLAKKVYDSVMLAGLSFRAGDSHIAFRNRLAQAKSEGQLLFSSQGYYKAQKYTIFRYGIGGLFAPGAVFEPNSP